MTIPADLHRFATDLRGSLGSDLDLAAPLRLGRAPGRLDVLGGIADYSGSLCLELPLREAACAAVQRRSDGRLVVRSPGDAHRGEGFACPAEALASISALREATDAAPWTRYLLGPLALLQQEHGADWSSGATVVLRSEVPEGAGVSSSAAIEVAVLVAACGLAGISLSPRDTALLAQRVENHVVGAPCGVMDQCTVACGAEGALLRLLCQPCELQGQVVLPADLAVWGINSGQRHAVGGGDYGSVRTACAMGKRILAGLLHAKVVPRDPGRVEIHDAPWGAALVNLGEAAFNEASLPEHLSGSHFLARYHGIDDPIAFIDPSSSYAIRACTAHPIREHPRVVRAADLLAQGGEVAGREVGALMFASHASYGRCGLGASGPDRLVDLVRAAMARGARLYGAKITGGGSGGTVAILGHPSAEPHVRAIAAAYAAETGHGGHVFTGSSPGACALGSLCG